MTDGMRAYLDEVHACVNRAAEANETSLSALADRVAATFREEGWLYVFGTGHSHMLAEELFFRAGGSPRVRPLLIGDLMLHESASRSSDQEREIGRAEQLLGDSAYPMAAGDVLLVASNSGRNAVPIELAIEAKERGVFTVALTSLKHARAHGSRHLSGKRLDEVVDLVLDNGVPAGDACVPVGPSANKAGALSTVVGASLLQMLHVGVMERLATSGDPEMFVSSNADGGSHNAELLRSFRERVKHL